MVYRSIIGLFAGSEVDPGGQVDVSGEIKMPPAAGAPPEGHAGCGVSTEFRPALLRGKWIH